MRVGVKEGRIRHLIRTHQIEHIWIGNRVHIPVGAFGRFLEAKKVKPCQGETKGQNFAISKIAEPSISLGQSTAAAASAALARQTASKLKRNSASGCSSENDETAQVIPLRSS